MSGAGIVMMLLVLGGVWGGFVWLLVCGVRAERRRGAAETAGERRDA